MLKEEEKKAIEDSKELIEELEKRKDKDFIGRLYYKNKPIEDTLRLLLNIIEKLTEKVKQLEKEIEEMREELQMYVDVQNNDIHNYISKDKIREK
jgi:hypothetical protein